MWRIKVLTEVFGPAGFGWWTNNVRYDFVECEETKEINVFCELDLYVKDPETGEISQPIYGIGGNTYLKQWRSGPKASDEAKKMAYTDALGIACKALGVGHDIWYSNDRTKYTMPNSDAVTKPAKESKPAEEEKAEPKQEHTADTASVIAEIDKKLAEVGAGMAKDEKIAFAKETIVPIIGSMNYKTCTDINKLNELKNKLCA
jgi:hypothetical protein